MKILIKTAMLVVCLSILSGCVGMGHITYNCVGQSKQDVLAKFGPPEEVVKSIENVETWEYRYGAAAGGDSIKSYTFQGDKCLRQITRPHK